MKRICKNCRFLEYDEEFEQHECISHDAYVKGGVVVVEPDFGCIFWQSGQRPTTDSMEAQIEEQMKEMGIDN